MSLDSVFFRSSICFTKEWSGFDTIKPVNVIIGRNNSGKSHLLGFVEALCQGDLQSRALRCRYRGKLDEESLQRRFSPGSWSNALDGDLWQDHGRFFVDAEVEWDVDVQGNVATFSFASDFKWPRCRQGGASREHRERLVRAVLQEERHRVLGRKFRRLVADRDIRPEAPSVQLGLEPGGEGASNLVRRFITTSNEAFPRALVQDELLESLKGVFGGDGHFTEIQVRRRRVFSSGLSPAARGRPIWFDDSSQHRTRLSLGLSCRTNCWSRSRACSAVTGTSRRFR